MPARGVPSGEHGRALRLFHVTDRAAADGIMREGFARSDLKDSEQLTWLADKIDDAMATSKAKGVVVIVELPDEIAAQHRYGFKDGTSYFGNYCVPWEVLNAHRPFEVVDLNPLASGDEPV